MLVGVVIVVGAAQGFFASNGRKRWGQSREEERMQNNLKASIHFFIYFLHMAVRRQARQPASRKPEPKTGICSSIFNELIKVPSS